MYIPDHFQEQSLEAKHRLIRSQPLGTLITRSESGLNANHIPFVLEPLSPPDGKLLAHVPRINPLLQDLQADREVLVIFHGPNGYISPSWYATKKETGKVVPTWNYAVVHAYGEARIIDDAEWLYQQLSALTESQEAGFPQPWKVSDAPADFTDKLIKGLVGIEIQITRLLGKTKASQNHPPANRQGVIEGLESLGDENSNALAEQIKNKQSQK